jgi:hypothetical protein
MDTVLVVAGFFLTSLGYVGERQQRRGSFRARAVGMALFLIGEILLFGVDWRWGLSGLVIPPLLIEAALSLTRRWQRREQLPPD